MFLGCIVRCFVSDVDGRDSGLVVCYRIKLVLKHLHTRCLIGQIERRGSFKGPAPQREAAQEVRTLEPHLPVKCKPREGAGSWSISFCLDMRNVETHKAIQQTSQA